MLCRHYKKKGKWKENSEEEKRAQKSLIVGGTL